MQARWRRCRCTDAGLRSSASCSGPPRPAWSPHRPWQQHLRGHRRAGPQPLTCLAGRLLPQAPAVGHCPGQAAAPAHAVLAAAGAAAAGGGYLLRQGWVGVGPSWGKCGTHPSQRLHMHV
eukprot:scaffold15550_cov21-Tisochrysis_lutea.AAC.4